VPRISNYALQYSNISLPALFASPYDLIITEGQPLPRAGAVQIITDAQVAALQAQGRTVVGYVNVGVTDTNRSYWNAAWTSNGDDLGTPTAIAPSWLAGQPQNLFGTLVKFWDPAWQALVIAQARDLVHRGYDGIFLDDVAIYFTLGAQGDSPGIAEIANRMANFVALIASEIRTIRPDAYVVVNSDPYLVTNVTNNAAGVAAAQAFLQAVDAHLLENSTAATIDFAQNSLAGETILLLTSDGAPAYTGSAAWARGLPYTAPSPAYNALGTFAGRGTASNDVIFGGNGPNLLEGLDGNDVLVGGLGNDTLSGGTGLNEVIGGLGNDIYIVTAATDSLVEFAGEGIDEARTALPIYVLPAQIEALTFTTDSAHLGIGSTLGDVITGGAGVDDLFGRAGNDTLIGGAGAANTLLGQEGDDVYVVQAVGDSVIEFAGDGVDTVQTALNVFVLRTNVENLTYTGSAAFTGIGAEDANILRGGAGDDFLSGLGGNDILSGGSGADLLIGGSGADQFRFVGGESGTDRILDFTSGSDLIALGQTTFVHSLNVALVQGNQPLAAISSDSTFFYRNDTGILSYDADGNGAGVAVNIANLGAGLTLAVGDFLFY
jgi:uncharacterized protein (TIGR01370 family)